MSMRTIIFFRAEGWYPTEYPRSHTDWAAEAKRNPGTLRIEDALTGNVLWRKGPAPVGTIGGES
jgi:hypothetical protein